MGIYNDFEYDFIDRTLKLITQYELFLLQKKIGFNEQYNYTLLINCLLGIIVMPKERVLTSIPNDRIISELKHNMGLIESTINPEITKLSELIVALRHSIAHFDIEVLSLNNSKQIDEIVFKDEKWKGTGYEVARFKSVELLPFIRYYADWVKSNLNHTR